MQHESYKHVKAPDGWVAEHAYLAEQALGKPVPAGAELHHINGTRRDNSRGNLVLCQDRKYHRLLHQRKAALKASGHAHWRKCRFCKEYDDPKYLYISGENGHTVNHRECFNEYERSRRRAVRNEAQIADDEKRAAGLRKCWVCKQYDDPENLYIRGTSAHHRECHNRHQRDRRASIRTCD